jgi:hypothetical protein
MAPEFLYLFKVVDRSGVYRIGMTDDLGREVAEGGLGLDPACPVRPRGKAKEAELIAGCWVGRDAPAVRSRLWRVIGRPEHWGNGQMDLPPEKLERLLSAMLEEACRAVRVPRGFISGHADLDWEEALNAGLEDAVRSLFTSPGLLRTRWPAASVARALGALAP